MIQTKKLKECVKSMYVAPLPAHVIYHDWRHTEQVEEAALDIAKAEMMADELDLSRLKSAAYVHDLGNLVARKGHERTSVSLAYQLLPLFGASEDDLKAVDGLVMATELPQEPKDLLEKIMCDADLSLMGYKSWIDEIDKYRIELGIDDMKKWYEGQVKFLGSHQWHTDGARALYDGQKQKNIQLAKDRLNYK
jgi:uncharacterized protein